MIVLTCVGWCLIGGCISSTRLYMCNISCHMACAMVGMGNHGVNVYFSYASLLASRLFSHFQIPLD